MTSSNRRGWGGEWVLVEMKRQGRGVFVRIFKRRETYSHCMPTYFISGDIYHLYIPCKQGD
jgi:hypothetical protein